MNFNSVTSNENIGKDISNICTLYVNTSADKLYASDTESDLSVAINLEWEKQGINKISCIDLSVPISKYLFSGTLITFDVIAIQGAVTLTQGVTLNVQGMCTSVAKLVEFINDQVKGLLGNDFFKYDYDPSIGLKQDGANDPVDFPYNVKIVPYATTGRIYSNSNFSIKINQGADVIAPILGVANNNLIQASVPLLGKYAMPYVSDIIPYSIIYLACDQCSNGLLSSNGSSILASILYNNEQQFTYMRQDFGLEANSKWITKKTNALKLYFLDENKQKIKNFNGISAFITLCLYKDSSEPPVSGSLAYT